MNNISVIIPCYNVEKYIGECIDSVLKQTHQAAEIICINDGSTDGTLVVLNTYQSRLPDKIKVVSFKNQGAPASRNAGFRMSTGTFIQFLDADDVLDQQKFEKQLSGFNERVEVVVSDRVQKNENLTETLHTYHFDEIEKNPLETAVKRVITTCNPLYKRHVVEQLGGYGEQLKTAQDWDFHIRLVLAGFRIKYVPGIFFINRKVKGSLSSDWKKVSIQAADILIGLESQLLKSSLMNKEIKQYIAQLFMDSAIFCKQEDAGRYIQKLITWAEGNFSFINNRLKRMAVSGLGIKKVIRLQRLLNADKQIK
jgi:glycosyltransferase involved in cell wall biosynthesis